MVLDYILNTLLLISPAKDENSKSERTDSGFQLGHNCLVFKSSLLLNGRREHPSHISQWEEATHRASHHRLRVPPSRVLTEHSLLFSRICLYFTESLGNLCPYLWDFDSWTGRKSRRAFLAWLCCLSF